MTPQTVENRVVRVESPWFVCQTNPREEKRARHYLEEKGFEVFLPMMVTSRAVGLKAVPFQRPLFPGYLFVRMNGCEDAAYVRWTQGIRKMLPDSLSPLALEDGVVESIRMLADKQGLVRKRPLRHRDRVRILAGPFKGLMGVFEHWASDQGRVAVLLEFVSYQARVELHCTQLEKVA